jgi:hypothetical protein
MNPQDMADAGTALAQLGNWMTRTYPQVTVPGEQENILFRNRHFP